MSVLSLSEDGDLSFDFGSAAPVAEESNIPNVPLAPDTTEAAPAPEQGQEGAPAPEAPAAPTFTHGQVLDNGLMVVNPKEGIDITQFASGQKLQRTYNEVLKELQSIRAEKAEAAKKQTYDSLNGEYVAKIRSAKSEVEKARLYVEFVDKKAALKIQETEAKLQEIENQTQQSQISETLNEWNNFLVEKGFTPEYVGFLNQMSAQQAGNDPVIFHERRLANHTRMVAEYMNGNPKVQNIYRKPGNVQAPAPQAPAPPPTPAAFVPAQGAPGQVDGVQLLMQGKWDQLDDYLNRF
jgi:hypothetical protein